MSEIPNSQAPEKQRATMLSVASFLRMLPYVVSAPVIGYLNTHGQLHIFLIVRAAVTAGVTVLYLASKKRNAPVDLGPEVL